MIVVWTFADDHQRAQVCQALLQQVKLASLWTLDGPTPTAMAYVRGDGGPLSSGERMMLLVAWDIWTGGEDKTALGEIITKLDGLALKALGSLLVALGTDTDAVQAWLRVWNTNW